MENKTKKVPMAVKLELAVLLILFCVFLVLLHSWAGSRTDGGGQVMEDIPEDVSGEASEEAVYMEYGTDTSLEIDASGFISPETKNNLDLVAFAQQAWQHQWGYVWGTYGRELTEELLVFKLEQYPQDVGDYEAFIREHWLGRRATDCVGLIKAYCWYDPDSGEIPYNGGVMPDCGTEDMFSEAEEKGTIDTIPEIPGVLVYRQGHVGVYIGGGYVIEAAGTETGVVKTKLDEQPFTHWMKCPYIDYYS